MDTDSFVFKSNVKKYAGPIIVNFPCGSLTPAKADKVTVTQYERKDSQKPSTVLVAETPTMGFVAEAGKTTSDGHTYCLARVNRRKKEISLHDAMKYDLQPLVSDELDKGKKEKRELSFIEKHDKLTESFGSNKRKRAMHSRIRNHQEDDVVDRVVTSAVSDTLSKLSASPVLGMTPINASGTMIEIPPYLIDAKRPEEVYNIDDIISPANRTDLDLLAKTLVDVDRAKIAEWKKEEKYPPYILHQLTVLPLNETARIYRCTSLLYLQFLMNLYQCRYKSLRDSTFLPPDTPESVKKRLCKDFILLVKQPNRKPVWCMPSRLKDKVLSHLIVLALIIDEFRVNMDLLNLSLKLSTKHMIQAVRAVGGSVIQTEEGGLTVNTATLTVPLKFPDPAKKARSGQHK